LYTIPSAKNVSNFVTLPSKKQHKNDFVKDRNLLLYPEEKVKNRQTSCGSSQQTIWWEQTNLSGAELLHQINQIK
jgi:hypothetical protein